MGPGFKCDSVGNFMRGTTPVCSCNTMAICTPQSEYVRGCIRIVQSGTWAEGGGGLGGGGGGGVTHSPALHNDL